MSNPSGTANQTQYYNNASGAWAATSNLSNNGTTVTIDKDASINGLTVGKGSGTYVSGNGAHSTALGVNALNANTSGNYNVAIGFRSLWKNNTGANNFGIGSQALQNNLGGGYNTAIGTQTLINNSTGNHNIALGSSALYKNTTGERNIAIGHAAILFGRYNSDNLAVGYQALWGSNSGASAFDVGDFNVAIGNYTLEVNEGG